MITRVYGTPARKQMVTNVVENLRKIRPAGEHIDYELQLENNFGYSRLITSEYRGHLRNISQLCINDSFLSGGIEAVIGNKTGAVDIEKIPFFMSTKKAMKKITRFLELLQQENRVNPIATETLPVESKNTVKMQEVFDKYKLQTTINSSESKATFERVPRYRTL